MDKWSQQINSTIRDILERTGSVTVLDAGWRAYLKVGVVVDERKHQLFKFLLIGSGVGIQKAAVSFQFLADVSDIFRVNTLIKFRVLSRLCLREFHLLGF